MLNLLRRTGRGLAPEVVADGWRPGEDIIWIDLVSPTPEEERAVEQAYGIDLPTREEIAHVEPSSRLYQEDGATFLTATLLARADEPHPVATPVTFVLLADLLITVRYEPLKAFSIFAQRCAKLPLGDGGEAALELLDAIVERCAEVLEQQSALVHETSVASAQHRLRAAAHRPGARPVDHLDGPQEPGLAQPPGQLRGPGSGVPETGEPAQPPDLDPA